jgi:hypothetical protein
MAFVQIVQIVQQQHQPRFVGSGAVCGIFLVAGACISRRLLGDAFVRLYQSPIPKLAA